MDIIGRELLKLGGQVLTRMITLVRVEPLFAFRQLKGIQADIIQRFITIAKGSLGVPYPFGTGPRA